MAEHSMSERIADLDEKKAEASQPGSERSIARQQERGKMLARERIDYLLDEGSFHEIDMLARRSEEHTSELQSLMRSSYAVFRLKNKTHNIIPITIKIKL